MMEKYEVVRAIFHGLDYSKGITGAARERLVALADAIEWVLAWQKREADRAATDAEKKRALNGYQEAVMLLSKAYALASASDEARRIRDEVGFFQAVRAALVKNTGKGKLSDQQRMFAVGQLINQAIANTEIVDILAAAGLKQPNLSVLSDEFLLEVQQMERKNLALEALRKLLNGEIKSRTRSNVVETRKFTERLESAVARYHANALSTVEVIQELIKLAQDMRAAAQRGEARRAQHRRGGILRRPRRQRQRGRGHGRREVARDRYRAGQRAANQRDGRLAPPRECPRPHANAGEEDPAQIRLSARPARCGRADGDQAGGGHPWRDETVQRLARSPSHR